MDSEEQFSERAIRFVGWIDRHRVQAIAVVVIVLAVAAIWGYSQWKQGRTEEKASRELLTIETPELPSAQQQTNVTSGDYLEIAEKYPSTQAGLRARLLAGKELFAAKEYKRAQEAFEAFLSKASNDLLAAQAAYGVAASLEAQGETEAAVKQYQQVIDRYPESSVTPQARFSLARLKERESRFEEALALYDEVIDVGSGAANYWASQARQRRQNLLDEHPELAETNQVSSATSTNLQGTAGMSISNPAVLEPGADNEVESGAGGNESPSDGGN